MDIDIKRQLPLKESGNCANCGTYYTTLSGVRVLATYTEIHDGGEVDITEPFNLCIDCYNQVVDNET